MKRRLFIIPEYSGMMPSDWRDREDVHKLTGQQVGRDLRMDAMRVFAAFSVVMLHAAASSWNKPGPDFIAAALFDTAVRYSVPVFVMLSGAFLLDPEREMPLKKLYQRHVLQTAFVLLVWSVGYAGFHQVLLPLCRGAEISWKTFSPCAFSCHPFSQHPLHLLREENPAAAEIGIAGAAYSFSPFFGILFPMAAIAMATRGFSQLKKVKGPYCQAEIPSMFSVKPAPVL